VLAKKSIRFHAKHTSTPETLLPKKKEIRTRSETSNVHHLSETHDAYKVCLEWRINFKVPRVIKIKCQPQLPLPPTWPRTSIYIYRSPKKRAVLEAAGQAAKSCGPNQLIRHQIEFIILSFIRRLVYVCISIAFDAPGLRLYARFHRKELKPRRVSHGCFIL